MISAARMAQARAMTAEQCERFALLAETLSVSIPAAAVGDPLDEALSVILGDTSKAPGYRACVAWLAATASYPLQWEVDHVAALLEHGRHDLALHAIAGAMLETGLPARTRRFLPAAPIQIDVTSVSRETSVSGIPRTVVNLVRGSAEQGGGPHVWSHGALAPVDLDPDDTFVFDPAIWAGEYVGRWPYPLLRRTYHGLRSRAGRSRTAAVTYRVTQALARPFLSALAGHSGPQACLLLHDCTVVVPEVCHGDVADRLVTWRRHVGGFELTVLVHDLLPVVEPQWFTRSHIGDFMAYVPVIVAADRVVTTTSRTGRQVVDLARLLKHPEPPVTVAPLPVTSHEWASTPPADSVLPRFVCLGTVEPRKNHDVVLRACMTLAVDRYPVSLTLVGNTARMHPSTRDLIGRAREAGVQVDLVSGASDAEVRGLLESSVASVFMSWAEGYGLPVLESLACGTPVLCSAVEPLTDFAEVGGMVYVDPVDHLALAEHMRVLITDAPARDRLAAGIDPSRIPVDVASWSADVHGRQHERTPTTAP